MYDSIQKECVPVDDAGQGSHKRLPTNYYGKQ